MKQDIIKNTMIVVPNGMADFKIMATPATNVNIPKKVKSPVARKIKN